MFHGSELAAAPVVFRAWAVSWTEMPQVEPRNDRGRLGRGRHVSAKKQVHSFGCLNHFRIYQPFVTMNVVGKSPGRPTCRSSGALSYSVSPLPPCLPRPRTCLLHLAQSQMPCQENRFPHSLSHLYIISHVVVIRLTCCNQLPSAETSK